MTDPHVSQVCFELFLILAFYPYCIPLRVNDVHRIPRAVDIRSDRMRMLINMH